MAKFTGGKRFGGVVQPPLSLKSNSIRINISNGSRQVCQSLRGMWRPFICSHHKGSKTCLCHNFAPSHLICWNERVFCTLNFMQKWHKAATCVVPRIQVPMRVLVSILFCILLFSRLNIVIMLNLFWNTELPHSECRSEIQSSIVYQSNNQSICQSVNFMCVAKSFVVGFNCSLVSNGWLFLQGRAGTA